MRQIAAKWQAPTAQRRRAVEQKLVADSRSSEADAPDRPSEGTIGARVFARASFVIGSQILRMSVTYLEAIREAQAHLLREDKRVFIYGQDIAGKFGGAFKATKGLAEQFPGRVLNTPISEDAMVGTAIGAAMEGMRPIVEMQFADFSSIALNQILNNAGTQYWRTQIPCPITVRLPSGGTKGSGPFHSQSMEGIYSHYPGLVVVTPATVEDAYTMLIDAVAIDDPVIYCEHKYLYYHLKADALPTERLPIGKARIVRPGRDLSIVTYSAMVHEALAVAQQFSADGIEIEVVDLRTREAARYRHRARIGRADRTIALRRRSVPVGRRHGGSDRTRRERRISSARCRAGAHQRERHADSLSPESLERASAEREDDRGKGAPGSRRIIMPKVPITMPQLGESMAEATIVAIKVQPGDKVAADQEIIEVETDKAVMGVTTPCAGEIAKIDAEVKGTYAVGAVLGYVEASEADAARFVKRAPEPPKGDVAQEVPGREEESAKAVQTQNGSGSHFQVDEAGLPPVAAGSHFQVDQLACCRCPQAQKARAIFRRESARAWLSYN